MQRGGVDVQMGEVDVRRGGYMHRGAGHVKKHILEIETPRFCCR